MNNWFNVPIVGIFSITGIEVLEFFHNLQPDIKFAGQTVIGVLTIIYLYKQIKKLNKK